MDKRSVTYRKFSSDIMRSAKLIVSPSNYFIQEITDKFPDIDRKKIFVSPSGGVDVSLFSPGIKQKDKKAIGCVTNFWEGKGWRTLLKAAEVLHDKGIDFELALVGRGPEVNDMQKEISDKKYIKYLGCFSYEQLPEVYRGFDIFVFPTQVKESFGLVGIEAMSCGIPVIGSKIGGLTDYIEDGVNGFYFSPGNHIELSEKIETMLNMEEEELHILRTNAISTAHKFDSQAISENLFEQLNRIFS